jgi:hypothetical protein
VAAVSSATTTMATTTMATTLTLEAAASAADGRL